ncbi:MAG: hypothetical protein KAQ87_02195 [Candidatus Pacebacteria bacterium]|nr:hypothetical protein [Candidatus Paceibacterota bacterium]
MFQKAIKIVDQKTTAAKSALIAVITILLSMFLFINNALADWAMPAPPVGVPANFDSAVINLTNWVLGFVAMIAVLMIVFGGVMYIGSAGDETKATTGKRTITYALIGLIIAGIAYALVNIIVTVVLQ